MTRNEVLVSIMQNSLKILPSKDESVIACMVALHTHDIVLADSCSPMDMTEKDDAKRLYAITRRHAAEIVAAATGNGGDQEVINHWYTKCSSVAPYEILGDVPKPLLNDVLSAVEAIRRAPHVRDIVETD